MDIIKVKLLRDAFLRVKLGPVFRVSELLLAIGSVVIDSDLAVSSKDFLVLGQNKWVDLNHVTVFSVEAFVYPCEDINNLVSILF
jgi:hypothetical protein